jgi:hypothetical protein
MKAIEVHAAIRRLLSRPEPGELTPAGPWDADLNRTLGAWAAGTQAERCLKAALHLWNDDLWACHDLVQDEPDEAGAYLHGVLHRREPDAGNASYWFHRVRPHPLFPELLSAARELASGGPDLGAIGKDLAAMTSWDPFRMIRWCDESRREEDRRFLRALQAVELQGLAFSWLAPAGISRP